MSILARPSFPYSHELHSTAGVQSASEFFHTMRRQFTSAEWNTIRTPSTEMGQLAQFYRHWVGNSSAHVSVHVI